MSTIFILSLNLVCIYFFFWLIKPINFARFMPYTPRQAAFLKVVLPIIGGYLLASFFVSATNWVIQIPSTILGN
ncbi:MAG: DUF1146 family protein [Leuconostoc mesenteroides]|jgi:uncharacterized membrane protein YwzB|uniref:DUF1146 family protein n=1 Tax=Leuconostoc mesenteroides TaxID=1245 RepID=UPI000E094CEA|nr:DUF1146 family protein [Leuconostoc mesenteroides]MCT3048398.1 DUF1146 domain-containing protein [Leuconostoc mesenteroides]RDF89107.1 DUF1146 domain-containing protein [Leuconostoc mesenteroides subsp. mesenteroides]